VILKSYLFKKVTIVGVGLMGGSLGMALKKHEVAREVVGLSHRQSSIVQAIKCKAIDAGFIDVAKAIRNADLVVLATPVDEIIKLFPKINPHLKRGCIVTDLGSAKAEIVEAAKKSLSAHNFFIGSHPLAGSDKKGINFAQENLYEDSACIITPVEDTHNVAKLKIKQMWTKLGSKVKSMDPKEHDEILSYISHLPHLMAYALMNTVPDKFTDYASSGLKDTTRVAASSPQLWNDIFLANSKNVIKSLDELIGQLSLLRKSIVERNQKDLTQHLTLAKEKRDGLK